ncbi:MAG TPA: hypothetical protein VK772_12915 [Puia sp.]|nr:hypothetical protein [Puia sp.]
MTIGETKESRRINRLASAYNMIPNLIWTTLFLLPVAIFCYSELNHQTVYMLLGISLIPIFFPKSFFDFIQLSRKPLFYKRIGVKFINKFAQNGEFLNRYMRKKYPGFTPVPTNKSSVLKYYNQTYFFEKFHFSMFIFFIAITVYALIRSYLLWALTVSFCNLFYNIYPNLLQQYIRLRLLLAIKRSK